MPPLLTLAELLQKRAPYMGQRVRVLARVAPSLYYNYGYRQAQQTHASFQLTDGTSTGYAYAARESEVAAQLAGVQPAGSVEPKELTLFVDPAREKGRGLVIGEIEAMAADGVKNVMSG